MPQGASTRRRRPRAGVVLLSLLLLLAACGGGTAAPPTQDPGATATDRPAPSASDDHQPATSLEPIPVAELDEELVASLVAEGYTETEAAFLALTNVDGRRIGEGSYEIVAAFPTGNRATIGIELSFDQVGDPEELTVSTEATAEGLRIHLEYLVPYEAIPADAVEQLRNDTTADAQEDRRIAMAGLGWLGAARHVVAKDADGIGVVIDAVIGEARDDAIGAFVDFLQERMNVTGLDALLEGIKSLLGILDAMKMSTDLEALKARIDALEDCARNPTDPLTKRRYAQDPNALQEILDAIERVRADVKANTAVMYVGLLNKTGSGLVKVPGLNYVVGVGTAWSEETLKALNESYIEQLRQMITPCEGYQFEFDGKAFGTRMGEPARIDFHYWGVLCPNEEQWRIWEETDGENLDSYVTQRPENTAPMLATFTADGQLANILLMGEPYPNTWYGTTFVLETPDAPATITATIPLGDGEFEISERTVPADDTIFDCP